MGQFGSIDQSGELFRGSRGCRIKGNVTVAGRQNSTQCADSGINATSPFTRVLVGEEGEGAAIYVSSLNFHNGHVQVFPHPRHLRLEQRNHCGKCSRGPGLMKNYSIRQVERGMVGGAGHGHGPAHPVQRNFVGPIEFVGPRLPEIRDRCHHQPGIELGQLAKTETQSVHCARIETLYQYLRCRNQLF